VHSIQGGLKASEKQLRSGELAKAAGVSTDTLRHYECLGLLPRPRRTRSNYRQYSPDAVQRVELIQRALSVGFSLAELARVLRVRDAGGAPCQHVRALAADKLNQIDRRLRELVAMQKLLKQLIADCDERLKRTPDGQRAVLLELLPDSLPTSSRKGIRK
jgi:DNA-binding transcriptional MerR regulator